jgi:hypothetical protein
MPVEYRRALAEMTKQQGDKTGLGRMEIGLALASGTQGRA